MPLSLYLSISLSLSLSLPLYCIYIYILVYLGGRHTSKYYCRVPVYIYILPQRVLASFFSPGSMISISPGFFLFFFFFFFYSFPCPIASHQGSRNAGVRAGYSKKKKKKKNNTYIFYIYYYPWQPPPPRIGGVERLKKRGGMWNNCGVYLGKILYVGR